MIGCFVEVESTSNNFFIHDQTHDLLCYVAFDYYKVELIIAIE